MSVDAIKDVGIAMMSEYHMGATGQLDDLITKERMPRIYPSGRERYYVALTRENVTRPFWPLSISRTHPVADLKTKRQKGSQLETDNSLQLSLRRSHRQARCRDCISWSSPRRSPGRATFEQRTYVRLTRSSTPSRSSRMLQTASPRVLRSDPDQWW